MCFVLSCLIFLCLSTMEFMKCFLLADHLKGRLLCLVA
jgi:hypothetical protein